ncbi:MAG TPA: TolC family protein [Candidatus Acidoferrum sp.]|nr:TolC family protein [Candidatus Acidoferrum sp.]
MNLIASKNKATRWRTGQSTQQQLVATTGSRKTSTWKRLLLIFALLAGTSPEMTFGQQQQVSSGDVDAPLLTLNDAVTLALQHNWNVKNSVLEAQKQDFEVSTARSKRKPQFQFSMLGGELLRPFDFTFQKGVFGTYPGVGPIPGTNAKVHTPAVFTTYLTGSIDQPLTQQYKIGLGIHATELGRDMAREDVRAERQKIAAEVRTAYFNLFAIQANVDAAREGIKTFEEAQRVTVQYVAEKTVLRAEELDVDARLAKSRYELSVAENGLATQREALNQLLGRDVATLFRVEFIPEQDTSDLSLDSARQEALANRPELRQAHLKEKQAEYNRRLAKAEYIPDLSLSLRYQGVNNVQVLPQNVATAGFYLSWEPFDWGRRHNNVVEAAKTVEQARNGIQETESKLAVEVGGKYRKWHEASLLLKASRIAHEAAAEQLRVTGNKYKEHAALLRDLLQTQAQSSETNFQYQQALSSYWSAFAELRKAMGEE